MGKYEFENPDEPLLSAQLGINAVTDCQEFDAGSEDRFQLSQIGQLN